jgi:hypothetical protein
LNGQRDILKICKKILKKYKVTFDLNSILSRLIYARIIFPSSKLATFQLSIKFIEQPNFELQHIYRALEVIAKEHRPNPIVQMGLFMDGDGIPLAFSINKGNTNEQLTELIAMFANIVKAMV